jgi:hypothetical protein
VLSVLLGSLMLAAPSFAQKSSAKLLDVDRGYTSSEAFAVAGGVIAGGALPEPEPYAPALWEGRNATFRVLPYSGNAQTTIVRATDGVQHVGMQYFFDLPRGIDRSEAVLWEGSTLVSLHQSGWEASDARAVHGGEQGGVVLTATGGVEATLWSGTAASARSLHPGGFDDLSAITGMAAGVQVGGMDILSPERQYFSHALWWAGSAASVVDLHPAEARSSFLLGTDGAQHAGYVIRDGVRGAALWTGTTPAPVSLHAAGALESEARGVAAGTAVGYSIGEDGIPRARAWRGSADGAIDLHAQLPPGFLYSFANGIDGEGNVVGSAYEEATGYWRAVLWSVPVDAIRLSDFLAPLQGTGHEQEFLTGSVVPVKLHAKNAKGAPVKGLTITLSVFDLGPAPDGNAGTPGTKVLEATFLSDNGVYNYGLDTGLLTPGRRYRLVASEPSTVATRVTSLVVR